MCQNDVNTIYSTEINCSALIAVIVCTSHLQQCMSHAAVLLGVY